MYYYLINLDTNVILFKILDFSGLNNIKEDYKLYYLLKKLKVLKSNTLLEKSIIEGLQPFIPDLIDGIENYFIKNVNNLGTISKDPSDPGSYIFTKK